MSTSRALAMIVALGLALRLALFAWALPTPTRFLNQPDSGEYDLLAQNLLTGHGFSQSSAAPFAPDLRRTPVYPALLAVVSALTQHNLLAAILLNIAFGTVTILLTFVVARVWLDERAALFASLLLALDVTSITYNNLLLTETTFTLLLVLSVCVLLMNTRHTRRAPLVSGLLLGVATLCRPIGIFLSLALLPTFAWRARRTGWMRAALDYALLNVGFAFVVGLWLVRNMLTFGVIDISSLGAVNLYFHRAAFV
ncbi:MAG: glycosyltransferase family 39 protein, partial [Chloroflexi bacterium]|nr:glycosyltransferase family 39 protein [Chloroflexota bacterium]